MGTILKQKSLTKTIFIGTIIFIFYLFATAFVPQVDEWKAPPTSKDKKNPVTSDEVCIATAKKLYEKECLSCHGKKGRGDGEKAATLDKQPQDLTSSKVQSQTDGELFWKISEGKKPMPANKKNFSEEQRWQLVNYVRSLSKKK